MQITNNKVLHKKVVVLLIYWSIRVKKKKDLKKENEFNFVFL